MMGFSSTTLQFNACFRVQDSYKTIQIVRFASIGFFFDTQIMFVLSYNFEKLKECCFRPNCARSFLQGPLYRVLFASTVLEDALCRFWIVCM